MVPLPRFATWDDFNAWLEEQCRKRQADVLRGHQETIAERLQRDLAAMVPLPPATFEACDQATGRVSSQALVSYKTNDYSVPVAYGHRDVWIRGYVDQVGHTSEPPRHPTVRPSGGRLLSQQSRGAVMPGSASRRNLLSAGGTRLGHCFASGVDAANDGSIARCGQRGGSHQGGNSKANQALQESLS